MSQQVKNANTSRSMDIHMQTCVYKEINNDTCTHWTQRAPWITDDLLIWSEVSSRLMFVGHNDTTLSHAQLLFADNVHVWWDHVWSRHQTVKLYSPSCVHILIKQRLPACRLILTRRRVTPDWRLPPRNCKLCRARRKLTCSCFVNWFIQILQTLPWYRHLIDGLEEGWPNLDTNEKKIKERAQQTKQDQPVMNYHKYVT